MMCLEKRDIKRRCIKDSNPRITVLYQDQHSAKFLFESFFFNFLNYFPLESDNLWQSATREGTGSINYSQENNFNTLRVVSAIICTELTGRD